MEADERDSVEISNGVTLIKDMKDKSQRTFISPHVDPTDYRNVLEATAELIGRRSLRWDMSFIHPGLVMRVGPAINGASVLEFVMERGYTTHYDRTVGTGQILRQILLPLLLGFKLKLITLVPLLIGILVIVSKKALFLSKIAVFVTAVLGLNSLLFLQQPSATHLQNAFGDSPLESQTLSYHNLPQDAHLNGFRGHVFRERDRTEGMTELKGGRNFLWDTETSHGVSSN
ncbi:hypothetical protein B7P43_G07757 [Cryptotermes secundus]|uniref:Uncharacterized protein n=1 Tax=Cryptotermes secundus TaxID=105785 RepID=A0A2J7QXI2_9NEOP|nr:hypothetical protein B7P43_G07757 [Cryptotermes secundus]